MSRILVVGCGGIGGIVAARLSEGGRAPSVLVRAPEVASALSRDGFRLSGLEQRRTVAVRVVTTLAPSDSFDFVLLATQPTDIEKAARAVLPNLHDAGRMVVLANGLCEERVAGIAGAERVFGAVVAWGARTGSPGEFELTARGGITVGSLRGTTEPLLFELAQLLECVAPVETTTNLTGKRWSKLALNCAVSSLGTIGGDHLGPLLKHAFVRRLALEVMSEAALVARAEGVALEPVSGTIDLDWICLRDRERERLTWSLLAKHALLLAVGARYRKMQSSMLVSILRGKPPAVDFLNGEIVRHAERHGILVPYNRAVTATIHRIARGETPMGLETLRKLSNAPDLAGRDEKPASKSSGTHELHP